MDLPGYDLDELVGAAVWRARTTLGEVVALKRFPGVVQLAEFRRAAGLWQALVSPYVVRLRAVETVGDDAVLVLDYIGGGSLADLLARRDRFTPGEVVTLGVPLAKALAAAHAAGLAHGRVTAANVLLTEGGMPLLTDFAVVPSGDQVTGFGVGQGPGAVGDVASEAVDVAALGELLQQVLDKCLGSVPILLQDALEAARNRQAGDRPEAKAFATALRRSCPVSPLLTRDPGPIVGAQRQSTAATAGTAGTEKSDAKAGTGLKGERPLSRLGLSGLAPSRLALPGWVRPRWVLVAAGAVVVLAGASAAGWASGQVAPVATPVLAPVPGLAGRPATAEPDWQAELDRLDAARAVAFSAADPALLAGVDAPGSPAMAADRAAMATLRARGLAADGVRHRLLEVTSVLRSADGVSLRVVDERQPVRTVDRNGRVVATLAARARATYDVELVRGPGRWLLSRVTARPAALAR